MSNNAIHLARAVILWGIRATLAVQTVIVAVLLSTVMTVRATDPVALAGAAKEIAEIMPTDVVRLALMTSIVSQLALVSLVFARQKTDRLLLQKPCVLNTSAGKAVVREFLRDGKSTPSPQED